MVGQTDRHSLLYISGWIKKEKRRKGQVGAVGWTNRRIDGQTDIAFKEVPGASKKEAE